MHTPENQHDNGQKNTIIWRCIYLLLKQYLKKFPACQPCLDFPEDPWMFFFLERQKCHARPVGIVARLGTSCWWLFFLGNNPGWSGKSYCLEPKWPLFWLEKALFWGGWPSKIGVIWVLGVWWFRNLGFRKPRQSVSSSFSKKWSHYFLGLFTHPRWVKDLPSINALFWKSF